MKKLIKYLLIIAMLFTYIPANEHVHANDSEQNERIETVELFKDFSGVDFFLKEGVLSDGENHVVSIYSNTNNARMAVIPLQDGKTYHIKIKNNDVESTKRMKLVTFKEVFSNLKIAPLASERNMNQLDPNVISTADEIIYWNENSGSACVSEYEGTFVNTNNAKTMVLFTAWGANPDLVEVSVTSSDHIIEEEIDMNQMIQILLDNIDSENQATQDILQIALNFWAHRDEFIYCSGTALDQPWNYWSYTGYVDSANTGKTVTAKNAGYKRIDCSTFVRYVINGIDYYSTPYYNALELTEVEQGGLDNGIEDENEDFTICRSGKIEIRENKKLILESKNSNYKFTKVYGYDDLGNVIQEIIYPSINTVFTPSVGVNYLRVEMKVTSPEDYTPASKGVPAAILKCLRIREDEQLDINASVPLSGYRNANEMCRWFDNNGYAVEFDKENFDFNNLRIGSVIYWGRKSGTWAYKNITHTSLYIGDGYVMHVSAPNGLIGGEGILIEPIDVLMERYDLPLIAISSPKYHSVGHSYIPVITEPTCTEQGYTTYTCECGDSYVDDYVKANGHTYAYKTCLVCGDTLEGKKVSILSASHTTYEGVSNDTSANSTIGNNSVYYTEGRHGVYLEDTWWQQVIDVLGMELLVNNSWSGSCVLQPRRGEASVGYGDRAINLHNDHTGEEPDIIWVWMGCNDFGYYKDTFGKADDVDYDKIIKENGDGTFTYATPKTTCEAYAIMLHKIQQRYPNAEVYCMTSYARREPDYEPDGRPHPGQPTIYNAELMKVAEVFGCFIIDLEDSIPKEAELFDKYIGDKRAHPNALGMDLISQRMLSGMLGKEIELADVSGTYTNVYTDNTAAAAIKGMPYQAILTTDQQSSIDATIVMNGVDVTSSVYNNGIIYIENVTGDIEIIAKAYRKPMEFRFEMIDGHLVSVGKDENNLNVLSESISDGIIKEGNYQLGVPIILKHNESWIMEWKCSGDWRGLLLTTNLSGQTNGNMYLARTKGGQLVFGIRNGSQSNNYGIDLSYLDLETNVYKLENHVTEDGNMVYLYLNGNELGPMNNYFIASKDQEFTSNWLSGKDFEFYYIGSETTPLTNCQLDYFSIWESSSKKDILLGDVNSDGEVNVLDRTVLARYLAHWVGYDNINEINADVNLDGVVNSKDRMILARHLARWNGYEKLPYMK